MEEKINEINSLDEITLANTVSLMNSDNYKDRFIAEYMQLKIRYGNLRRIVIKEQAGTLEFNPTCDICHYESQLYHMDEYLKILEVRAEIENIKLPNI